MPARLFACLACLTLAACGAALPGYTPPPFKDKGKLTVMKSGEVDADGVYHMSELEKATDCKRLTGTMMITINRLKQRTAEVGTSSLAIAANKTVTPFLGGSGKGLDRDAEQTRDRARLAAYNQHLASKSCPTVDIEAELARPLDPPGKKY
jgi:hypothetical protein